MSDTFLYLVEIGVKDWIHVPDGNRALALIEVRARGDYYARFIAFDQYWAGLQNNPEQLARYNALRLTKDDICARDVVEL